MQTKLSARVSFIVLFAWTAFAGAARAHEIRPAVVSVGFEDNARYTITVTANLEALLAGIAPQHQDSSESPNARSYDGLRALPPAALQARWRAFEDEWLAGVAVEFDGRRAAPRVTALEVPEVGDALTARISRVRLTGAIPEGAREFRWRYAPQFGASVLRLPAADGGVVALWLQNGRASEPYVLGVGLVEKTRGEVIAQYGTLGFTHILPFGLDHILFVLGLYLLSLKLRPLLIQVTAFTVAHTITLALSIYGVFSLPSSIVEPLIAASIVYVAVENLVTRRLHVWRPFVVFGFGLLHGLGFAGVLEEVGLPRGEYLTGLISFNVGVEFGQLAVIALAHAAVGHWFGARPWYRARVALPASALIALVGAWWTVERVFF